MSITYLNSTASIWARIFESETASVLRLILRKVVLLFVRNITNAHGFDQIIEKYALKYGIKCLLILVEPACYHGKFLYTYNNEKIAKNASHSF